MFIFARANDNQHKLQAYYTLQMAATEDDVPVVEDVEEEEYSGEEDAMVVDEESDDDDDDDDQTSQSKKVPVSVITGFLGSGKSTLLNHILTDKAHGQKFAVIENEVGAVAIDNQIIKKNLDEEIIEVTNGCICCSIRGDLVRALENLHAKVDLHGIDGILLETTGLLHKITHFWNRFMLILCPQRTAFQVPFCMKTIKCHSSP